MAAPLAVVTGGAGFIGSHLCDRLLDAGWGWDYPAGARTVDTRMVELRRALADDPAHPKYIETLPGEGYRFAAAVRVENKA